MDSRQQRVLIFLGSIIAVLLIVLIFILLSDDGESTVALDSAVTATVPTTSTADIDAATTSLVPDTSSTVAAPATTVAPATTAAPVTTAAPPPVPSGVCSGLPSATMPGPGPDVTFAEGDFDGDGLLDELIGYMDAGGQWWVQIAFGYGYAMETAVFGPVTALGADDFGTGQDVGYAYVDSGASTQIIGFFFAPGCDIYEATLLASGALARFPLGGGVMHLDGLTCNPDGFTTTSATTGDGVTWEYTTTDYLWVPGLLEFESTASSIALLTSPADDATIFSAAEFDCPLSSP